MADIDVSSITQIENPRENSKTAFEFDVNLVLFIHFIDSVQGEYFG